MKAAEEIIKEFLKVMAEQDNRGTAAPYYYTIRWTKSWEDEICVPEDVSEWDDLPLSRQEEERELRKALGERAGGVVKTKGMFLTEEDAESHLSANNYHYPPHAKVYLEYAWRSPQMEAFFAALFYHFDIDVKAGQGGWQFLLDYHLKRRKTMAIKGEMSIDTFGDALKAASSEIDEAKKLEKDLILLYDIHAQSLENALNKARAKNNYKIDFTPMAEIANALKLLAKEPGDQHNKNYAKIIRDKYKD